MFCGNRWKNVLHSVSDNNNFLNFDMHWGVNLHE